MKMMIDCAVEAASVFFEKPVTRTDIRRTEKHKPFMEPRFFVACWLIEAGFSYPQAARAMHRKDHTTVMHSRRRGLALWERNPEFHRHMIRARLIGMGHTQAKMPSRIVTTATEIDVMRIGMDNLDRAVREMREASRDRFVNGKGWEAAA